MDELLTRDEVAKILKKSPRTLDNWRTQGRGPAYVLVEGTVRYPKSALEEYIASGKVEH